TLEPPSDRCSRRTVFEPRALPTDPKAATPARFHSLPVRPQFRQSMDRARPPGARRRGARPGRLRTRAGRTRTRHMSERTPVFRFRRCLDRTRRDRPRSLAPRSQADRPAEALVVSASREARHFVGDLAVLVAAERLLERLAAERPRCNPGCQKPLLAALLPCDRVFHAS